VIWVEGVQRDVGGGVIAWKLSLELAGGMDLGGVIEQTRSVWRGELRYRVVLWVRSYTRELRDRGIVSGYEVTA
jgi:hypothetical protein